METLFDALKALEATTETIMLDNGFVVNNTQRVDRLVGCIHAECDAHLITDNGRLNYSNIERLAQKGYRHRIVEQDSHGPLVCAVETTKGWVSYN